MIAYLDLPSGLSGDMFLGCLVDAGWPIDALQETLARLRLPADSWSIHAEEVLRRGLRATLVHVQVADDQPHRSFSTVRSIIEAAELPPAIQAQAIAVFARLARAEAGVHGQAVEQIHFHEVGALDAIVDIVGVAAGLHELGVQRLYASPLPLGPGWVDTAHGRLPLPAPATLALLAEARAPTLPAPGPGEWVTPTAAALLAQLATFEQPALRLERIGLGAGQRDPAWPNVARLWLGETEPARPPGVALHLPGLGEKQAEPRDSLATPPQPPAPPQMVQLETNIDDMNPELYEAVSQRLFAAGARDVWLTPIQMKKGRPGVLLAVLAPAGLEQVLADLLLRETTTLGLRVQPVRRHEAGRALRRVETRYGPVQVKLKWVGQDLLGATPEYDDCRRLADAQGVPVRLVYEAAQAVACAAFEIG